MTHNSLINDLTDAPERVYNVVMMFDGYPVPPPPCPECTPARPIDSFISLGIVFWLLFFLVVYILPPKWSAAIWRIVFPFMSRRK